MTRVICCCLFSMLWLGSIIGAQTPTGSLVGTVRDHGEMPVVGATVTARHVATNRERQAVTDERGDFVISGLDAGAYSLIVAASGFKQLEVGNVTLVTGDRLSVGNLALEVGGLSDTVSIRADVTPVQTRSAERAEVITNAQVEGLLVRGRNVVDLMQLVPGVVVGSQPEDLSSTSNFNVMGNRSTTNNITIDGVPATDMGNGSQLKLTVSQDNVAEVKILLSNYQAEYGRMAGSNVQIITKSGTRDFHGLVSYFKRHEQFNANNFFNNRDGVAKPRSRYNTWTYNIGGPVYIPGKLNVNRDKLFFFWGQEFWPTRFGVNGRVTVPTALEREGDFSQTLDLNNRLIPIRDPLTGAAFPNNRIPANRLDRSGVALLKLFPLPNFTDRNISRGQYNYTFTADRLTPKRTHTLKLDYNPSAKDTVSGSFNAFNEDQTGSVGIPSSGGLNWPQMDKTWYSHPKGVTARWTRIITPRILNEFTFGWLSQPARDTYTDEELNRVLRDKVGFVAGQLTPSANELGVIPNATFGGVPTPANLTIEGRFPLYNDYRILNWANNLTITQGPHTFKAGVYVERFTRNQKKTVAFNGAIDFGRNVNNPLDTNWAYSNAALGVFNSYTESSGEAWMNVRTTGTEAFVQDNWKATSRLTLDYGLRMYWIPPLSERDDFIAGFVPERFNPARAAQLIQPGFNAQRQRVGVHPVTGQIYPAALIGALAPGAGDPTNGMLQAGADPDYPRNLIENRGVQWGPRVGFAYDVRGDGKTAIRGGFGMFYNRFFTETFFNPLVGQPPLLQTPVISFGELARLTSSTGLLFPTNVFAADVSGKLPTVMNFSLSVQRDIGFGTVVDVAYAGSLGRHLQWRRDLNPIPVGANFNAANFDPTLTNRPLPAAFLRPLRGYNNVNIMEGASSSNYHSLQVTAKRRFARSLQLGAAWTWSKAMDFNDADTDTIVAIVPVRAWNYGLAGFDRTHILNINYIWDLPKVGWRNAPARLLFNDWQLSGITRFVSGQPLGIGLSTTTGIDITGTTSLSPRVNVLGNPVLPKSERTFSRNFRTEAFGLPAVGTTGNAAKTVVRGPGINNWDMALFKTIPLREQVRLQFRWELYNAFNHTQFSAVDTGARYDPATGAQVNTRFGEFTAARDPRQMQFALRLNF